MLLFLGDLAEEMEQETKETQDKADEYLLCCLAPKDPVHIGQAGTYWQEGRRRQLLKRFQSLSVSKGVVTTK